MDPSRNDSLRALFVIAGPTASGKTDIAIAAARALGADLIGADSMQVYRHMDIGTDKPRADQLHGLVHRMIDVVDPDSPYDAAAYSRDADEAIAASAAAGRRAILVGGTGLYIRVLLRGLQGGPAPDPVVRERITRRAASVGWPAVHAELAAADLETASRLHPNDGVRILRAMEVLEQSGVGMARWQTDHSFSRARYRFRMIVLDLSPDTLVRRIEERVDSMMARGFLDEVAGLVAMGYSPTLRSMRGLGYRRLCDHLAKRTTLEEAVGAIKVDTRRLAKRQRTWFRGERDALWVAPSQGEIVDMAGAFFEESRAGS